MALPCSTMAFAFGWFSQSHPTIVETLPNRKPVEISCFAPPSLLAAFAEEFLAVSAKYLIAATEILGEYPFDRMDLVILPRCFACMGLERYALYLIVTIICDC